MTSETFAQALVVAATVLLALAFVAHVAEWALGRGVDEEPPSAAMAASIGRSVTVLAWLVLLAGVVTRGVAAGRVPWGNMYEFGCAAVVLMLAAYLILIRWWGRAIDWTGAAVTGVGTVVLGASTLVYVPPGPLVPALHSYWLVLHVFAAMLAGAAFVLGAIASVGYLLKSRTPERFPRLPSATRLDEIAFKVNAFAFPIWTFAALIAGPIWAQYAWGRYWGWDPKEVWAFITWVVYAGYLHARATAGWKGRAAAILCLVGFTTFLFNFVGVNLFVGGLHSYAK
jgi:cytochrome c-type biogenesis protein CcsB